MRRNFDWHDSVNLVNGWDTPAPCENSALYGACERGDVKKVRQILESERRESIDLPEHLGWTPLLIAVAQQHADIAELLLQRGSNPNVANFHGRTPLCFAARYGNQNLVDLLLRFGANADYRDGFFFEPPLEAAALAGNIEIVNQLLEVGADPAAKSHTGSTALHAAQNAGHGEIAAILRQAIRARAEPQPKPPGAIT